MLGELVDCEWKPAEGGPVAPGDNIGWVEGFKAASDVYCVMNGNFAGGNPLLKQDACIVRSDPYEQGWLYAIRGEPEPESLDVQGYIDLLSATIHRMAEEGHGEEQEHARDACAQRMPHAPTLPGEPASGEPECVRAKSSPSRVSK